MGVNQGDLRTFEVDRGRAPQLAPLFLPGVVRVAESGIRCAEDVLALAGVGYDSILVGEALVTVLDARAAVAEMATAGQRDRSGPVP